MTGRVRLGHIMVHCGTLGGRKSILDFLQT